MKYRKWANQAKILFKTRIKTKIYFNAIFSTIIIKFKSLWFWMLSKQTHKKYFLTQVIFSFLLPSKYFLYINFVSNFVFGKKLSIF